ncbi:LOW QUALITY PROTEIN: uncharacterized protein KIAA0825-like [Polyodon spathula]|uniref:LOW QUALITY PROTEIN: uncharacterized protein KIAA0825-like n=1 Tax=Polyodon spathula TaxID=7913 RepID=UPI001B7F1000|nr:LOW QUALITY PROTEIN: uncharacterized protein KIAA0825-like [Polyodon spathula]
MTNLALKQTGFAKINLPAKVTPRAQKILWKKQQFYGSLCKDASHFQGQEETLLLLLLDISSQCGVSFVSPPSASSFQLTSRTSLHAIGDDFSIDVQSVWDDVWLHLKRFLVDKLQCSQEVGHQLHHRVAFKTQCLQQLLLLYPESLVLSKYQSIQSKAVQDLLQNSVLSGPGETNFDKLVQALQTGIPSICSMIKEDLQKLNGIMEPSMTLKFLNETYLSNVTDEFSILIEKICDLQFKENFCTDIMEELDTFLPLALVCREDFLQEIRANFVEVCSKVTAAVLTRLEERSKEVPLKSPFQNLHTLLSTAIHVLQRLTQYEARLKDASCKPLFPLPFQRYQELISALQDQVTSYCVTVCATSILQDPKSHHWGDPKVFYEGERCLFSIQMWHCYLSALRHDLWNVLPPSLAQEILAQVLSQTLEILVQRYSQECPTYRRTLQIRYCGYSILLCTENLIWSLCSTREERLHPSRDICPWISSIHSHCNHLLTALAIVTSSLHSLFEYVFVYSRKPETEVLMCLRLIVTKSIMSAVNQIMSMVYAWHAAEHHGTCQHRHMAPESLLNKIPKDWNYLHQELKKKEPGKKLDRWSKLKLGLLSECLQNIVGQQKGTPQTRVQKIIQNMEVQRPQWIKGQIQKARKLCTKGAFEPAESTVVQEKGSGPELTEQKIGMMVLDICHKPGGSEYLRQIYHIIQLNEVGNARSSRT